MAKLSRSPAFAGTETTRLADVLKRHVREDGIVNKNMKHLIGRMRNDLRALGHSRRDRAQVRLLHDLAEALGDLEVELLTAIDERDRRATQPSERRN